MKICILKSREETTLWQTGPTASAVNWWKFIRKGTVCDILILVSILTDKYCNSKILTAFIHPHREYWCPHQPHTVYLKIKEGTGLADQKGIVQRKSDYNRILNLQSATKDKVLNQPLSQHIWELHQELISTLFKNTLQFASKFKF